MAMVVIKEELEQQIVNALKFAAFMLDKIDPAQRLTHIAIAVAFAGADVLVVRTRVEHNASPNFELGI